MARVAEGSLLSELSENRRKVNFDTFDITVKELLSMVSSGLIDIAPEYQRQFRWTEEGQSTFVESVFLGIPIPSLFMAANEDGSWELIDGVQRLSTLINFCGEAALRKKVKRNSPLELSGLRKLASFNGKLFQDLPATIQTQFLLKPLKVTTISDKSDLTVRFDLFERLNTGGVQLQPQEIRSCIYRGKFNDFLRTMAQNDDFRKVVHLPKSKELDATPEELVLRFFAFYKNWKNFNHSVEDFLNDFMQEASKSFPEAQFEKVFVRTFRLLSRILPEGIVRNGRSSTPVNLFEGVSVGAALALDKKPADELFTRGFARWIGGTELKEFTTAATNSQPMVKGRIFTVRNRLLEV